MAGIYWGDFLFFRGRMLPLYPILIGVGMLLLCMLFALSLKQYTLRWVFGISLFFLCLIGGAGWMNMRLQQTSCRFPSEEVVYRAYLTEKPKEKERSVLCKVQLSRWKETPEDSLSDDKCSEDSLSDDKLATVLLYLAKDSLSTQLHSGDELLVSAHISPPTNNGNPDEYDYGRYAARKGVSGTGFVPAGHWRKIAHLPPLSFLSKALASREYILNEFRRLGFEGDAFAVLSALTVGYVDELDDELRESYSISGASHVLSLSGLHIGFLYALLFLLFRLIPGKGIATRAAQASLIILSLWGFAFFTGLSPSVVRSVCMFSLFSLSYAFRRESFTFNTLFVTAFFMLLCFPAWLFDVSFQLSFVAVATILWLQPILYRSVPAKALKTRAGRYVWGLMSVSIAAQIGTAPLVLYYFSRFSTHFLLTNLLVIPLASGIMYAAVILLLCTPFPMLQSGVAFVLKWMVELLNGFVRWVERLPYSSIDQVWVDPLDVAVFFLALWLAVRVVHSNVSRTLVACLSVLCMWAVYHISMREYNRPQQCLQFYNIKKSPLVHCIAGDGNSWLVYADSLPDEARVKRVAFRYWNRLRLTSPEKVTGDYQHVDCRVRSQIVSFSGQRICILNDNRWRNKVAAQTFSVDYLYLCNGYTGCLEWVTKLFGIKKVILDSSLTDYRLKALKEECSRLGIDFVSLSEEGSVRFML